MNDKNQSIVVGMHPIKMLLFVSLYYFVWFTSIYLGSINQSYYALVISGVVSMIQIVMLDDRKGLILWVVILTIIGFLVDSLWAVTGVMYFKGNPWQPFAAPWILALWINFSVLCFAIQNLLFKLLKITPLLALFGFPFAYYCGSQLGAAQFNSSSSALLLAGIWFVVFPLSLFILKELTNYTRNL